MKNQGVKWLVVLISLTVIIGLTIFFIRKDKHPTTAYTGAASDSATIESEINNNWTGIDPNLPMDTYEELKDSNLKVQTGPDYAIYSIKEAVLFAPGQSSIGESAAEKLEQISSSAEKRFAGGPIRIYGYTDSTGTLAENKVLAEKRVRAVKDWLIQSGNINSSRISTSPVGEHHPISSNDSERERKYNRRVEIVIRKR